MSTVNQDDRETPVDPSPAWTERSETAYIQDALSNLLDAKLAPVIAVSQHSANTSMAVLVEVQKIHERLGAVESRVTALENHRVVYPMIVSLSALLLSVLAMTARM